MMISKHSLLFQPSFTLVVFLAAGDEDVIIVSFDNTRYQGVIWFIIKAKPLLGQMQNILSVVKNHCNTFTHSTSADMFLIKFR